MNYFKFQNQHLYSEKVSIQKLVREFGTPLYITSEQSIIRQYALFEDAFKDINPLICYAVKANYNLSILGIFNALCSGADVGSAGELYRALRAGILPSKIVFSGVGKTDEDIRFALENNILFIKIESLSEIRRIHKIAKKLGIKANVAVRVNPGVSVDTHRHISTGGKEHKFGIDESKMQEVFSEIKKYSTISLVGFCVHIGSQINSPEPYLSAINVLFNMKSIAESYGYTISYFDIGGGFPVSYNTEGKIIAIKDFANTIVPVLKSSGVQIIFEPGRFMVANSSILVSEVLTVKQNIYQKNFIVIDAGMTELMRPALYDAYHDIVPLKKSNRSSVIADIVGPVCESTDVLARDRKMVKVVEEECLAICSTGAYGQVMANNYNGRRRPAEVLVSGGEYRLIRRRDTFEQLVENEVFLE